MFPDELMHLTRMLHFACQLPVGLYRQGACVSALPETIRSVGGILEGREPLHGLSPSSGQRRRPQYLENGYGEQYVYLDLGDDLAFLCGPFAAEAFSAEELQRRIRELRLPLGKRGEVEAHFRGLKRLSQTSYFYLGKLMEGLAEMKEGFYQPEQMPDMSRPYFERTYENRMALFDHPPFFLEQELSRMIRHGERENALKVLGEINRLKRATLAREPLRSLKNSLICSCTLFTRAAISGGVPADEAFTLSDTFIRAIEETQDLRALDALEQAMVLAFTDQVEQKQNQALSAIIRGAVAFIGHHLSEKLTVPLIAGHVFVSPAYLSSRFKAEMGMPLMSFIHKRRIEEACQFLRYSESSLAEIAAFYQFSSQSHFTQVFRRHTGMTPARYKTALGHTSERGQG